MVGLTRTVSNSKGYGPWPPPKTTWEKPRFDPNFIIEIEEAAMTNEHYRSKRSDPTSPDRHHSKPRPRSPLSPSAFEFLPNFNRKPVKGVSELFVSAKSASAIPVGHPSLRDALIQASLDASVRSVSYIASARRGKDHVELDAVVVERGDRLFFMDVVPARRVRDLEDEGLALIALAELGLKPWTINAKELLREPRCTNARFVWLYNRHPVPRELRKHILTLLDKESTMELGELERSVRSDSDPSNAVMALVCAGLLELDISTQPLQLTTIVRSRSRS
jgi:hypothetical protein